MKLTTKGYYGAKDQLKSDNADKFIGRGSAKSSTAQYAKDWGNLANCGEYDKDDMVFVSAEGNRRGRVPIDTSELRKAMMADVVFITDQPADRHRPYNVGEREVEAYLMANGYFEAFSGIWVMKPMM
jgi:hypothetical protein